MNNRYSIKKNENGKIKEYLDISYLYEKLTSLIIDSDEEKEEAENSKIYNTIETELGRTLSPIEYETIAGWLNANISEELIKEALKEAVLNGVGNLKYIDKILYDWTKKGYKKASDVRRKKRSSEEEMEFRKDCQALLEAVNDTKGMNPEAAEENKHMLLELICQALDIRMEECEE